MAATLVGVRTALASVAILGLAFLAAACGGSKGNRVAELGSTTGQSTSPSSSSRVSTRQEAVAYAGCMRSHRVPSWPDPTPNGSFDKSKLGPSQLGVSSSQIAAALQACKSLLPTYSATQQSHVLAQARRFSRCMRAQGATNFPDPESNGAIPIPHSMESSPTYLAALHFCLHKYGVPPPPTPAGGGS